MPHPEFERFREIVEQDNVLRDELWSLTEPTHFVATVVRRAAERGVMLVDVDVWEAYNAGRTSWLATQMP